MPPRSERRGADGRADRRTDGQTARQTDEDNVQLVRTVRPPQQVPLQSRGRVGSRKNDPFSKRAAAAPAHGQLHPSDAGARIKGSTEILSFRQGLAKSLKILLLIAKGKVGTYTELQPQISTGSLRGVAKNGNFLQFFC